MGPVSGLHILPRTELGYEMLYLFCDEKFNLFEVTCDDYLLTRIIYRPYLVSHSDNESL